MIGKELLFSVDEDPDEASHASDAGRGLGSSAAGFSSFFLVHVKQSVLENNWEQNPEVVMGAKVNKA